MEKSTGWRTRQHHESSSDCSCKMLYPRLHLVSNQPFILFRPNQLFRSPIYHLLNEWMNEWKLKELREKILLFTSINCKQSQRNFLSLFLWAFNYSWLKDTLTSEYRHVYKFYQKMITEEESNIKERQSSICVLNDDSQKRQNLINTQLRSGNSFLQFHFLN